MTSEITAYQRRDLSLAFLRMLESLLGHPDEPKDSALQQGRVPAAYRAWLSAARHWIALRHSFRKTREVLGDGLDGHLSILFGRENGIIASPLILDERGLQRAADVLQLIGRIASRRLRKRAEADNPLSCCAHVHPRFVDGLIVALLRVTSRDFYGLSA